MVSRTTFATAIAATLWSPAVSDELRPMQYKIRVLEQVRHEIIVEADQECGARTVALLEARRTSGSPNPAWKPSPPAVLAHIHEASDFAVTDIEPVPSRGALKPHRDPVPVEIEALGP